MGSAGLHLTTAHGQQFDLNAQAGPIHGVGRCSLPVDPTPTPTAPSTPEPVAPAATATSEKQTTTVSSLPSTGSGPAGERTSDRFLALAVSSGVLLVGALGFRIRERDAA